MSRFDTNDAYALTTIPNVQYLLPLLYLVLRHHTSILSLTSHRNLDKREILDASETMNHILQTVDDRKIYLMGCTQRQVVAGGNTPMRYFSCGIFSRWVSTAGEEDLEMLWGPLKEHYTTLLPPSQAPAPSTAATESNAAVEQSKLVDSPLAEQAPVVESYPAKPSSPFDLERLKVLTYSSRDLPDIPDLPPAPASRPPLPVVQSSPQIASVNSAGDFRPKTDHPYVSHRKFNGFHHTGPFRHSEDIFPHWHLILYQRSAN